MPTEPTFRVRFDPAAFDEDLLHLTPRGRAEMIAARAQLERDGLSARRLYRCESEMYDGTDLGGCGKTRLPWPDGRWGLVLGGRLDEDRSPYLQALAVGERHPNEHWRPSVYQLAHRRLHDPLTPTLPLPPPQPPRRLCAVHLTG